MAKDPSRKYLSADSFECASCSLETGQDVGRYRQDLESQEGQEEIAAGGHERHAGTGEQQQGIVLAPGYRFALVEADRNQRGDAGDDQEQPLEKDAEVVNDEHPAEERPGWTVPLKCETVGGQGGGHHRHLSQSALALRGGERLQQHDEHARGHQDQQRQERKVGRDHLPAPSAPGCATTLRT